MSLVDVKTAFESLPLNEESRKMVGEIVAASSTRGGMTGEERQKLLQILEIEEELADIAIFAAEEALKALSDLDNSVAAAFEKAVADLQVATA